MELSQLFTLEILFTLLIYFPVFPASPALVFRQGNHNQFPGYFFKVGLCDLQAVCVFPPINFWMP
jgi:hypothetical protein